VDGDNTVRQELFAAQLLEHVPLAAHIRHSLEQEPDTALPEQAFLRVLEQRLEKTEAERVLRTVIEWGRHGEVFEYDYHAGKIYLPEPDVEEEAAPSTR
jgi:NitT/TauT family transport system ATP-binding protein